MAQPTTFALRVVTDDGTRLAVDGTQVLDRWFDQARTAYCVEVPLAVGDHEIEMEYYENGGLAVAILEVEANGVCLTPT